MAMAEKYMDFTTKCIYCPSKDPPPRFVDAFNYHGYEPMKKHRRTVTICYHVPADHGFTHHRDAARMVSNLREFHSPYVVQAIVAKDDRILIERVERTLLAWLIEKKESWDANNVSWFVHISKEFETHLRDIVEGVIVITSRGFVCGCTSAEISTGGIEVIGKRALEEIVLTSHGTKWLYVERGGDTKHAGLLNTKMLGAILKVILFYPWENMKEDEKQTCKLEVPNRYTSYIRILTNLAYRHQFDSLWLFKNPLHRYSKEKKAYIRNIRSKVLSDYSDATIMDLNNIVYRDRPNWKEDVVETRAKEVLRDSERKRVLKHAKDPKNLTEIEDYFANTGFKKHQMFVDYVCCFDNVVKHYNIQGQPWKSDDELCELADSVLNGACVYLHVLLTDYWGAKRITTERKKPVMEYLLS